MIHALAHLVGRTFTIEAIEHFDDDATYHRAFDRITITDTNTAERIVLETGDTEAYCSWLQQATNTA